MLLQYFFFLVGVSYSGLPRTNPYSSRIENCNQGTPDVKSSGLNHSATLPAFAANYEARVNAPRASSLKEKAGSVILAKLNSFRSHVVNKDPGLEDPSFSKCGHTGRNSSKEILRIGMYRTPEHPKSSRIRSLFFES